MINADDSTRFRRGSAPLPHTETRSGERVLFRPPDFNVDVVEVGVIRVSLVMADHARRQRRHSNLLPLGDLPAQRLKLDETIEEFDDSFAVSISHIMQTEIRACRTSEGREYGTTFHWTLS